MNQPRQRFLRITLDRNHITTIALGYELLLQDRRGIVLHQLLQGALQPTLGLRTAAPQLAQTLAGGVQHRAVNVNRPHQSLPQCLAGIHLTCQFAEPTQLLDGGKPHEGRHLGRHVKLRKALAQLQTVENRIGRLHAVKQLA